MNEMHSAPDRGKERIRELEDRIQEPAQNAIQRAER